MKSRAPQKAEKIIVTINGEKSTKYTYQSEKGHTMTTIYDTPNPYNKKGRTNVFNSQIEKNDK